MSWGLVMILQNVFASIYALQSRKLAKHYKEAHFQILATTFLMVYLVFICYALFNRDKVDLVIGLKNTALVFLVASCFTVWTVLTFITYRFADASLGTLLTLLNLIAVVTVSSAVLDESLTLTQTAGSLILVGSILILSKVEAIPRYRSAVKTAIILALIASVAFGFAITGEKYLLDQMGGPTYAIIGVGAQSLLLLVIALIYNRSQFRHFRKPRFFANIAAMGLVRGGAGLLFILSLIGLNNASLVGALSGLKVIITTILAVVILRETRLLKYKIQAGLVAVVGTGLLLW